MSSEQNDEIQNQVNRWLEAILPGKKENGINVGTELDSAEVYDGTRHAFYNAIKANQRLREYSISQLTGNQSALNEFRKKLGQWHSAMLYADLLSYTPKNPDSELHLAQRMQALLREALVWFPDAIFAQVILHCREADEGEMKECTAIAVDNQYSKIAKKLATDFRKKTAAYAKKNGTTVSLDVHLRHKNRWKYSTEQNPIMEPHYASDDDTVYPRKVFIYPLPITTLYPGKIIRGHSEKISSAQEKERPFFDDVVAPVLNMHLDLKKKNADFGMLHIAQGVDVVFDGDKDTSTVCHLYVMTYTSQRQPIINRLYNKAMTNLLSKLAHFSSIQRMVIQQKELEKQAHMLELVNKPLQRLGDALQASQQDIQEVYSIMHEPSHCIFAAQPKIAELFYDNQSLSNPDGTALTIEHQPIQYNATNRKWVFAHALSRLRGAMLEGKTAEEALKREVASLTAASEDKLHVC